jgi:WD40 repeat protein
MIPGATAAVHSVAFRSTDGSLSTTGADGEVRIWATDPDAVIADLCDRIGDSIMRGEWSDHSNGLPYDPPCLAARGL